MMDALSSVCHRLLRFILIRAPSKTNMERKDNIQLGRQQSVSLIEDEQTGEKPKIFPPPHHHHRPTRPYRPLVLGGAVRAREKMTSVDFLG